MKVGWWVGFLVIGSLWKKTGAEEIEYYPVEGRVSLRDKEATLGPVEVVLNGGEYRTLSRTDGSFTVHDVKPGVYLLDVLSVEYFFSQVKLNLPRSAASPIQCLEYKYPGAPKQSIEYPLNLRAHGKKQYFDQRESMGLHTLFRNPMLLMMAFTGVMVMVMPKLMENMDPEEVKKMQATMGASQDPASFLKHLMGVPDDAASGGADDAAADTGGSVDAGPRKPTITM